MENPASVSGLVPIIREAQFLPLLQLVGRTILGISELITSFFNLR